MLNKKQISRAVHVLVMCALVSGTLGLQPVYADQKQETAGRSSILSPEAIEAFAPLATPTVGNWSALGSNLAGTDGAIGNPYPLSAEVDAIAVSGTDIYVGGCFVNAGGDLTADYLAKWDTLTATWSGIGNDGAETPDGALKNCIRAMAVDGDNVYVGGVPTVWVNGAPAPQAQYLAKWDGTSWSGLGDDGAGGSSIDDQVTSIAIGGNHVYVGGYFTRVNNYGISLDGADHIAKWDTLTENWSMVGNNGNGTFQDSGGVEVIKLIGSDLYVGGNFTTVFNGWGLVSEATYIAKWDGTSWSALGNNGGLPGGPINNAVIGLATDGTDLYVAGGFADVNNYGTVLTAADYIAKWDGTNWSALGDNGAGNGALNNSAVGIQLDGADVYVSGGFTNVNNGGAVLTTADYIAKWDALTGNWSALGSNGSGNGALNNYAYTVGVVGDELFVGGRFTDVNNNGTVLNTADYIAAYGLCRSGPITVQNTNDSGPGSLRQAIADICPDGTINFDISLAGETIILTSDLILDNDLTIDGSGLSPQLTISGGNVAHLEVINFHTVTISDLTIANGYSEDGGGAISVFGNLTITNSTLRNNYTDGDGGAIKSGGDSLIIRTTAIYQNEANDDGGALSVVSGVSNIGAGSPIIENSTISQNQAGSYGGALQIYGNGGSYITNSTITQNHANTGGGISIGGSAYLAITNSTFAGNSATNWNEISKVGSVSDVVVFNTIFVCTAPSDNCYDTGVWSGTSDGILGVGTLADYGLAELADNGGPTQTMALLPGSALIDAGDDDNCVATDQRGVTRPQGDGCDIGAFEYPSTGVFNSTDLEDGWILESSETSGTGGKLNKTATLLRVGDDAANRQYRSILSFDTPALPEGAVITSITLKFKYQGKTGTLPFSTHGKLLVDICEGEFKNNPALQLGDFNTRCPLGKYKARVLSYINTKVEDWYSQSLLPEDFQYINFGGVTQFRLRFAKDDNNDFGADFLKIFSGNALNEADRPQLVIEYYMP